MSVPPDLTYRFNATSIKIPASYFAEIDKRILRVIRRDERPRRANTILRENNGVGGKMLPDFKTYYNKATVIQTMLYWQKNRQRDQWDRIKSLEVDPHKYSQLMFDKRAKAIQ